MMRFTLRNKQTLNTVPGSSASGLFLSERVASPVRERLFPTNCIVQGILPTLQLSAVVFELRRKLPFDWFSSAEGATFLMTINYHLAANTLVYTYTKHW